MFENFHRDLCMHLSQRRYRVLDENLLKSLLFTFFSYALKELATIIRKIESDQKYQMQLTEKALA